MQNSIDVINIYGMSYSGSTLLNFMLDCVPGVYGGGELHWLHTQHSSESAYKAHCTNCKDECDIWTPERCENVPESDFYQFIQKITGASVIVDTSKIISWFDTRAKANELNVTPHNFLLVKHPFRHLASLVINQKNESASQREAGLKKAIGVFSSYYREVLRYLSPTHENIIQYEELVRNNIETINRILVKTGQQHQESTLNCFAKEHHQIAGNGGTIYLATKKWPGKRENQPKKKLEQYESKTGVFLDNKYVDFFTPDELLQIKADRDINKISQQLGYDLSSAP